MAKVTKVNNKLFTLIRQKEIDLGRTLTNKEVAVALGVSVNTLRNWLEGDVDQFAGKILRNAKEYFGLDSINELIEYEVVDE